MGSWLTSLINSQKNQDDVGRDPHAIAAYTLLLGLALGLVALWTAIIILTVMRICKKLKRKPKTDTTDAENVPNVKAGKRILRNLRQNQPPSEFEMIELKTKPGAAVRSKSSRLGIKLKGGQESDRHGDPGIFIDKVKPGSIAEGKLFPGDRIIAVNDFHLKQVSLVYAKDVIRALRQAEGHLKLCIKRAPLREQRVNEAFSMYCDDEETGKKVVFNEQHMDVFEDAFSLFEERNSGKIRMKNLFPLLRSLGYNIHQSDAWDYMNELGLADQLTINFSEFVKFVEQIVADQLTTHQIHDAYDVFDPDEKGHVTVVDLREALDRLPGRQRISDDDITEVLSLADHDNNGCVKEQDFERLLLPSLTLY